MKQLIALVVFLSLFSLHTYAQEAQVMLRSTIKGSQEQPRVITIVPWQPPEITDLLQSPMQRSASESFQPLDRSTFQRKLEFQRRFEQGAQGQPIN